MKKGLKFYFTIPSFLLEDFLKIPKEKRNFFAVEAFKEKLVREAHAPK